MKWSADYYSRPTALTWAGDPHLRVAGIMAGQVPWMPGKLHAGTY
jgi:hypothetical protein